MIIEGLVTCHTLQGPHVAALGPVVDEQLINWTLRPFQSSRVFGYLREQSSCIFHVIDDVLPVVQLVLDQPTDLTITQHEGVGWIIDQACHWYRLEIHSWNIAHERSEASATVVTHGSQRPFWGWNRAKHALLEAAILISRASLISADELSRQLDALRSPIEKTAGPRELAAWQLIQQWRVTLPSFSLGGSTGEASSGRAPQADV